MAKQRGGRGRYRLLSPPEPAAVVARFRAGARVRDVMVEFGAAHTSACLIRDEAALVRRRVANSPHRLSFEEREWILVGVCRGESDSEIGRALGRHRSTIGPEIRRCGGLRREYRPLAAERVARRLARRPKATKLPIAASPRSRRSWSDRPATCCSPASITTARPRTSSRRSSNASAPCPRTWRVADFCDPGSPWQRASNENTNGLLRQYLPRKLDLAARNQVELDHIAAELNGRPRKTLDWSSPAERMETLLR